MSAGDRKPWDSVYHFNGQTKAIDAIVYRQFKRCIDIALLDIAAHVQIAMIVASVGESVNKPRVTMEVKYDGFVYSE